MANVTIQPSNADNYLLEQYPTSNQGTDANLYASPKTAARQRSILKFDFSAVIPAGATITLATLSLYCAHYLYDRTISVYRLLRTDWVETEATWNEYRAGSNWGTEGALNTTNDITNTDAATATSVAAGQWINVTVTAQVQTALDSVSGVAHFLMADVGANNADFNSYCSREYATVGYRPKLYVEYTVPSGPALLKTVNGLAKASVKTVNGLAIASVKTWRGLA